MNHRAPFLSRPARLLCLSLSLALWPVGLHAQPPHGARNRPAAHPSPSPAARPAATPAPAAGANDQAPPTDDPADTAEPVTEIDATDGANFSSKDRIAIFTGTVRVVDPRFQLACDKLTVFLNKSAPPAGQQGAATPTPGGTPAADGKDPNAPSGGIDHAIAEGHVIILQKRSAAKTGGEEKLSIGRGDWGSFDNKTGDMTLKGMPSIEQNGNTHVATSRETIMIIHKDSSLETKGPNQTKLIQHKGGSAFDLPGGPTAPTPRRAGGAPQG